MITLYLLIRLKIFLWKQFYFLLKEWQTTNEHCIEDVFSIALLFSEAYVAIWFFQV